MIENPQLARTASIVFSLAIAYVASHVILQQPVSHWFAASAIGWTIVLVLATLSLFRTGIFGVVASLFATIVVGRLFSTVHLVAPGEASANTADPLLLAETGPGVPLVTCLTLALGVVLVLQLVGLVRRWAADATSPSIEGWGLAFVRLYVGLMFIPHFAAHIFAGPMPFAIFTKYFGEIGLPAPAAMVTLAGVTEMAVAIGLSFGFLTRLAGAVGALYLFLTMLLGNHFPVGYIWILPTGGYEFGIFWAVMSGVFAATGGGIASLDHYLRARLPGLPRWLAACLS